MTPDQLARSGTEHGEQRALFGFLNVVRLFGFAVAWDWAAGMGIEAAKSSHTNNMRPVPEVDLVFAIPNGGKRDKITAGKLKAEGVKAGVPDIFLPVPRYNPGIGYTPTTNYAGLFIEMKRGKSVGRAAGKTSYDQDSWIPKLQAQGYKVVVCYTWREAATEIEKYLTGG